MSKDADESSVITVSLFTVVGLLTIVPAAILYGGFVLWCLYCWFAVPLGAPAMGLAHAIGVRSLLVILTPVSASSKENAFRDSLIRLTLALVVGYTAHLSM